MKSPPKQEDESAATAQAAAAAASKKPSEDEQLKLPLVQELGPHDVIMGRGLGAYNHTGNIEFRNLVTKHKLRYIASSKNDKPKIAKELVRYWRQLNPPGRFLKKKMNKQDSSGEETSGDEWEEVGDRRAQEKTSQCLRERTPDVMPYYKHIRSCRKKKNNKKDRRGEACSSPAVDAALSHQQEGVPLSIPHTSSSNSSSHSMWLPLQRNLQLSQQQQQQQQHYRPMVPVAPVVLAPSSTVATSTTPLAATTAAAEGQMVVPLHSLLRLNQQVQEKELEAEMLRRALIARATTTVQGVAVQLPSSFSVPAGSSVMMLPHVAQPAGFTRIAPATLFSCPPMLLTQRRTQGHDLA